MPSRVILVWSAVHPGAPLLCIKHPLSLCIAFSAMPINLAHTPQVLLDFSRSAMIYVELDRRGGCDEYLHRKQLLGDHEGRGNVVRGWWRRTREKQLLG